MITQQSQRLIELLFPAQCLVCALKSNNKLICHYCEKEILTKRFYCAHCALSLPQDADYCGDCLQKDYLFNHIHALGDYQKPLSTLIKQLKYQQRLVAGELLAYLLVQSLLLRYSKQQLSGFDYLLAVPLHPKKLQKRGFNQAQIIADRLYKQLQIPLLVGHIQRNKETIAQEGLSVAKRRKNLDQAFIINPNSAINLSGKSVVIIDDVVTTGSTINSLCKILMAQNVKLITVFCISRTAIKK